ncbi:Type I restriction enzyme R protein N terminus (HSDR_N) [Epsilonproteobacteria bacterium SCGC AD-308-E02]|jgi:hypothetical protein|nr:Type I restriction enzyme R protein N terminus (HSDR_N) [Epsilonproteobacteria bacterium SCGC AD-308-O04]SMP87893.1 Type I restriction enzyme R protein N terminus (HSDR_N) [Epsilonproteobacteria bacterium SCGC AD-308-E02]
MFQKSLLKNFIKSFNTSNSQNIKKLCSQDGKIDEDANGAEFLSYLAEFLEWNNYTREVKNSLDMKKADGVVYNKQNQPIAIIELKSSDKKISNRDVIEQAFRYKNEKPTCKYVIVSNFKELDIYCDSSDVSYNIDMTKEENYNTLYSLLNQKSLENDEIARLKKSSKSQEEITKEVYKEYSNFRLKLLNNLIENNKELQKETIFECANKLLDRFMFILFAEDRGLIPANSIDAVINQYKNAKEWGDDRPLYDYYKKYFHFIDVGNSNINIPKYNGNLFKLDEKLELLIIDDHIIKDDLSHLSAKDFSDDVDVEVLGHIFEQSLNDLEKIKESLFEEHKIVDTRKKDGVFYTPKFITEYIINNTVSKLCSDKKSELKLFESVKDTTKAKEKRRDTLHTYREYLESLKIVDPACGSGAFLNACFRFLLGEHKWIQSELFKYEAGLFDYHDIDKQIIEKNLFGVDINGASVGIAKLSLWLQTAKRDRPLSNLMNNIKCANSLTSDWNELFPEIMANGGFDCVIGNPPYFNIQTLGAKSEVAKEIQNTYPHIWQDKSDILFYFIAKAIEITKSKVGFITSNAFLHSAKAIKLRNFILQKAPISKIVNFEKYMVFEDASITSTIIELDKNKKDTTCLAVTFKDKSYSVSEIADTISNIKNYHEVTLKKDDVFALVDKNTSAINDKIDNNYLKLETLFKIGKGMETAADKIFLFKEFPNQFPKEFIKPRVTGRNIEKYIIEKDETYILYFEDIENFEDLPSSIQKHLLENRDFLENRATVKNEGRIWWRYSRPMHKELYPLNKIFCSRRAFDNAFVIDCNNNYLAFSNMTTIFDTNDDFDLKYLLALLNSKVLNFRYKSIGKQTGGGSYEYFPNGVGKLPIPKISKEQQAPFINLVDTIISSKEKIVKYKKHIDSLNAVEKIEIKEEIEKLESLILNSENEIDTLVYALYGLSEDEIKIVEE